MQFLMLLIILFNYYLIEFSKNVLNAINFNAMVICNLGKFRENFEVILDS